MLDAIVSTLKGAAKSDVFCTKIAVAFEELSLTVDPLGRVKFPISTKTAKSLIVEAEPAKFGKRDKTLLDRQVRDVWEIPKSHIKINGNWEMQLESALKQVQKNLELPEDGKLTAKLHNLLIYMPGQFFKGHQDSEKSDGMLATLVVLLPSEFSGGALVIDQHGDKQTFRAPRDIKEKLTCIAFYSDCHHEVKKVTAGYRVALTYNLIFKPAAKALPSHSNERLERELKAYFSESDVGKTLSYESKHPRWLVYLLDHQYTQKSLDWRGLRGTDRRRVAELLDSANNLGLETHLALADVHETWSTEGDDYGYGSYAQRGGDYDNEEDEFDEGDECRDSDEYELTELIEDDIELCHWVDRNGRRLKRKGHTVPRSMVCWTKAVDDFKPFNTEYEGYMGNYGNTLDRWYHRAAIVLWKKESEFANLFASDRDETLKKIIGLLKKDVEAGRAAIKQILPQWPKFAGDSLDAARVFEAAYFLRDAGMASKLVESSGRGSLSDKSKPHFLKLADIYGEKWCVSHLQSWEKHRSWGDSDSIIIKDLVSLTRDFSRRYRGISSWILESQLSRLISDDRGRNKISSLRDIKTSLKPQLKVVSTLLKAAWTATECEIHRKLIEHVLLYPRLYPAVEMIRLLWDLDISGSVNVSEKWGYPELFTHLKSRLEDELSFKRGKDDWSIREKSPHGCTDCKHLQKFLSSSSERKLVWPLAKERRRHIHGVIEGLDIPVTHVTVREGSPQKLILTKTSAIFERDEAHIKVINESLARLRDIDSGKGQVLLSAES
jgi:hypothetical protein